MRPRMVDEILPSDNLPDLTAYIIQKDRAARAAQKIQDTKKGEKPAQKTSSAKSSGNGLPLRQYNDMPPMKYPKLRPELRHKGKLPVASTERNIDRYPEVRDEAIGEMQNLRDQKRKGKTERPILPPNLPKHQDYNAIPVSINPFADPASASSPSNLTSRSTISTSSKLTDCIKAGADSMDEARRELTDNFRPPFDHIQYPSFSRSRQNSSASSKSFFCAGVEEPMKKVKALEKEEMDNTGQRLSGDGIDTWFSSPPKYCRLCRKPGVKGVRGLCRKCEKDFMKPKTAAFEFVSPPLTSDKVKPTPPLRDMKVLYMQKTTKESKSPLFDTEGHIKARLSSKNRRDLTHRNNRPAVTNVVPTRSTSRWADIEYEDADEDQMFQRWQISSQKAELDRTQQLELEVKSDHSEEEEPLIEKEEKGVKETANRDSSFFSLWDGHLLDHEGPTRDVSYSSRRKV
ncbi:hypothetical protein B7494_g6492 [Chlorociboria aeruginascens]|nr:hypothetical protein B7494_g6492 [Chlorociboria aeruginascens]